MYAQEQYKDKLSGGMHGVEFHTAEDIVVQMNLALNDNVWEIGCGIPGLAAVMSAVTGAPVLCTDIKTVHRTFFDTVPGLMANRSLSDCEALFQKMAQDPTMASGYVDTTYPFTETYPSWSNLQSHLGSSAMLGTAEERRERESIGTGGTNANAVTKGDGANKQKPTRKVMDESDDNDEGDDDNAADDDAAEANK
jgi:hypothetical protein